MKNTPNQNALEIIEILTWAKTAFEARKATWGPENCCGPMCTTLERIQVHIDGLTADLNKPAKSKAVRVSELVRSFTHKDTVEYVKLIADNQAAKDNIYNSMR